MITYINAADVTVFPFNQVLTSSSVMLAMSLGKPVIAPSLGCLPELIDSSCGWLYNNTQVEGLKMAMKSALECSIPSMGEKAYQHVSKFTWNTVAKVHLEAYGIE